MKPGPPARVDYEYERNVHRQPVHDVCAARRLAPHRGDGPPHRHRLCACLEGIWPIATSRRPRPSCSSRTNSTSTARRRSTRPSRPPKPDGSSSASNGTTPQSMALGSTSPSPNSASSPPQCLDRRIPAKQIPQGRNRRLGTRPQCLSHKVRLAIHNQRHQCQTQTPIPCNLR